MTGPNVNAKGEGKLNMVVWEGYADPSFVKQFEQRWDRLSKTGELDAEAWPKPGKKK